MSRHTQTSAPAVSTDGTQGRAGGRARRHWSIRKTLTVAGATAMATLVATGVMTGITPHTPAKAAGAATRNWISASGTIYSQKSADPATAAHFFNTPGSYDVGGNRAASPVPGGWSTTAVLNYTSYAAFASDIASHTITYPYKWVMYDPENWSATPVAEKQNAPKYMRQFAALAHANGLKVIMAPSMDLAYASGSVYPRLKNETPSQWYVRVTAPAAAEGDLLNVQNESLTTNVSQYQWLYNNARAKAKAIHPSIVVDSEVSALNGTASQMVTAAKSVNADGYFVAAAGDNPTVTQFLNTMEAAGY